jgi:hypothetical protein
VGYGPNVSPELICNLFEALLLEKKEHIEEDLESTWIFC